MPHDKQGVRERFIEEMSGIFSLKGLEDEEKALKILNKMFDLIDKAREEGEYSERQFILNILDGIDIADAQTGNKHGGTKAIRFALQSRFIKKPEGLED